MNSNLLFNPEFDTKINIDDLYETIKKTDYNTLRSYNKILERIHKRIKITAKQKNNEQCCWFVVPEIILGIPKYDVGSCIAYLIDKLKDNEFKIKYTHPNLLFISWQNKTNKNALMLEAPKQESNYSSEYSNSNSNNDENSLLFNTKKVSSVDDKLEKLLKNL